MSFTGDLESLVHTICFLLFGLLPWLHRGESEPDEDGIPYKNAFYHLAAEGQVRGMAGTRFQELVQAHYHTITTPKQRASRVDSPYFIHARYILQQAGWLTSPAAS
jgi:hypothetical protein